MKVKTTTDVLSYPFEVRPLEESDGGGYVITFPDMPGCRSDGDTPEAALANGREALADWIAVAKEFNDEVPEPFAAQSGRFVQRVPKFLHKQLVDEARNDGVSLNTFVVALVSEGLGRRAAQASYAIRSPRHPRALA